jgi:hypothetical protein
MGLGWQPRVASLLPDTSRYLRKQTESFPLTFPEPLSYPH